MKARYKNKRDFYKAEVERLTENVEFWKRENEAKTERLKKLSQPTEEKRIDCVWFCPNCRKVARGNKGINFDLEGSRCLNCGHMGVMTVGHLPFGF